MAEYIEREAAIRERNEELLNMVENVCVTVSNYATEALQTILNSYGEEGFSLVSAQMALDKYGSQVMYLFFVRRTRENWQPPKGE